MKPLPFDFGLNKKIPWVKLCQDEVFLNFYELYEEQHPSWGSLHIVLSDGNIEDSSLEMCYEHAIESGDIVGAYLVSQLIRVPYKDREVYDFIVV